MPAAEATRRGETRCSQRSRPGSYRSRALLGLLAALLLASPAPASGQPARYIVVLKATVSNPGKVAAIHAQTYGVQVAHV
jgi:hypothetical protein